MGTVFRTSQMGTNKAAWKTLLRVGLVLNVAFLMRDPKNTLSFQSKQLMEDS